VSPGVADDSLHAHRGINQFFDMRGGIVEFFEVRNVFKRAFEGDGFSRNGGNQFGDFVHFGGGGCP